MKKILYTICFLFFLTQVSFGTTYYSQGNLNPRDTLNWNTIPGGGGTIPPNFTSGVNDIFEIQAGHTMTLTLGAWTISGTGLCQVDSGATLICSTSLFTTGLTIAKGGVLNATATVGVNNGQSGFDFIINGLYRNSGSTSYGSGATGTCTATGKMQFAPTTTAGTIPVLTWDPASTLEIVGYTTFTGNMAWGNQTFGNIIWNCPSQTGTPTANSTLRTIKGDLTITSTGTGSLRLFANTAATLNISGNLKMDAGTLGLVSGSSASTINVAGNVTVNGGALKIGTSTLQSNSAKFSVTGNVLINGGTIDFKDANAVTGANIFEVGGNLSLTTGTLTQTGSTAGTEGSLRFIDTTTWSSGGTFTNTYINTIVNPASMLTLNNDFPIAASRSMTVTGVLVCETKIISGAGAFTLSVSGTLKSSNATGIDGSIAVLGTKTFTSGAGYIFNGAIAQITGTSLPAAIAGELTFSNMGGVVTLSQSTSNTGTTTVGPGAIVDIANFNMTGSGGTSVLAGSGKIRLAGDITTQITGYNSNTFTGIYEFTGSSQSIPAGTYSRLVVSGSNVSLSGNVTISDTLFLSNGLLNTGANTLTIGTSTLNVGNIQRTGGSINGTIKRWFAAATVNNVIFPLDNGSAAYVEAKISFTSAPLTGGTLTAVYHTSGSGLLPDQGDGNYIPAPELHVNFINLTPQYWSITAADGLETNSGTYSIGLIANSMNVSTTSYQYTGIVKRTDNTQPWTWNFANHVTTTSPSAIPTFGGMGFTTFSDFAVAGNVDNLLPVELESFTSTISGQNVMLSWSTISELNNSGYDIERKNITSGWTKIGNVTGHGTINTSNNYTYSDNNLVSGKYNYRLKQIDFNGNYKYYELANEVIIGTPEKYSLSQNYPNPFNPSTTINYELPKANFVSLKIYDMMGREVANLVNQTQDAGFYAVKFDASKLSSGIYFYKIQAGDFNAVKKFMLVK